MQVDTRPALVRLRADVALRLFSPMGSFGVFWGHVFEAQPPSGARHNAAPSISPVALRFRHAKRAARGDERRGIRGKREEKISEQWNFTRRRAALLS